MTAEREFRSTVYAFCGFGMFAAFGLGFALAEHSDDLLSKVLLGLLCGGIMLGVPVEIVKQGRAFAWDERQRLKDRISERTTTDEYRRLTQDAP